MAAPAAAFLLLPRLVFVLAVVCGTATRRIVHTRAISLDVTCQQRESTTHTDPQSPLTHRHIHHSHIVTTTTSHTGGSASLPCQVRCSAGGAASRQCVRVRVDEHGALMERVTRIRHGAQPLPAHGCPVYRYPLPVSRHAPAPPSPSAGHFGRP